MMTVFEYGDKNADSVLIQMTDEHDMALLEAEAEEIGRLSSFPFRLVAVKVDSWMNDLSPWPAPPVSGNEPFGGGAENTLSYVLSLCRENRRYSIGGYSLSALFALWCATRSDVFSSVAAASPSVWFPGFAEYMKDNRIKADSVYLSLGNKESKTRNKTMRTVADDILQLRDTITSQGKKCCFEWNEGGHFQNPEKRTARAFAYVLNFSK